MPFENKGGSTSPLFTYCILCVYCYTLVFASPCFVNSTLRLLQGDSNQCSVYVPNEGSIYFGIRFYLSLVRYETKLLAIKLLLVPKHVGAHDLVALEVFQSTLLLLFIYLNYANINKRLLRLTT